MLLKFIPFIHNNHTYHIIGIDHKTTENGQYLIWYIINFFYIYLWLQYSQKTGLVCEEICDRLMATCIFIPSKSISCS